VCQMTPRTSTNAGLGVPRTGQARGKACGVRARVCDQCMTSECSVRRVLAWMMEAYKPTQPSEWMPDPDLIPFPLTTVPLHAPLTLGCRHRHTWACMLPSIQAVPRCYTEHLLVTHWCSHTTRPATRLASPRDTQSMYESLLTRPSLMTVQRQERQPPTDRHADVNNSDACSSVM
jgi:hypothetical protein